MSIGENIKALRELYDITQKELAEIAGVTDKAVSTWELGTNEPRMGAIQKISDHFHIPKSSLIEDNELSIKNLASRIGFNGETNKQFSRLLNIINDLSPESWEKLLDFAELLKVAQQKNRDD